MNQYLAMLKKHKTPEEGTAKTAITPFGSNGSTPSVLSQKNKDPFGSFGSTSSGHISNNNTPVFDAEYWGRKIEHATLEAMNRDGGALEYCSLFMPLLHRRYMQSANNMDVAYASNDAKRIRQAIRDHDRAAEQTRKAAAQPLTADQLNPGECSRFCQEHLRIKRHECRYLNQLNGCTLWEGKKKRLPLNELPISPTRYLEGHQKESF